MNLQRNHQKVHKKVKRIRIRISGGGWVGNWEYNSPIACLAIERDSRSREVKLLLDAAKNYKEEGEDYKSFLWDNTGYYPKNDICHAWEVA